MDRRKKRDALYSVKIPISASYKDLIDDLLRLTTIQLTIFIMYSISASRPIDFSAYLTMQLFMWIGISAYWLIVKNCVLFTYD